MTYNEYLESCLIFSHDSQDYIGLDRAKFYTTTQNGTGWEESCDNANGGLDVSWSFHLPEEEVKKQAPSMYARQIVECVRAMIDNEVDYDTMREAISQFED